jgi:hypothetical protein
VGFVVDKVASFSPANSHSTDCSTIIISYHLGLVQQAKQWPQYQVDSLSVSNHEKKNKKLALFICLCFLFNLSYVVLRVVCTDNVFWKCAALKGLIWIRLDI